MKKSKVNYTYKPSNQSDTDSESLDDHVKSEKISRRRGIKESFTQENEYDDNYKNERNLQVNSVYPDLNPNVDLNSTTLQDLDQMEETEVINTENIYVDPFKPLFLPTFNKKDDENGKVQTKIKSIKNLSISDFLSEIANSYIYILDDLISGNYSDISELLLKENRGIATALLLIIISIFFIFFNNIIES